MPGLADPQRGHRWARVAALPTRGLRASVLGRSPGGIPVGVDSCALPPSGLTGARRPLGMFSSATISGEAKN